MGAFLQRGAPPSRRTQLLMHAAKIGKTDPSGQCQHPGALRGVVDQRHGCAEVPRVFEQPRHPGVRIGLPFYAMTVNFSLQRRHRTVSANFYSLGDGTRSPDTIGPPSRMRPRRPPAQLLGAAVCGGPQRIAYGDWTAATTAPEARAQPIRPSELNFLHNLQSPDRPRRAKRRSEARTPIIGNPGRLQSASGASRSLAAVLARSCRASPRRRPGSATTDLPAPQTRFAHGRMTSRGVDRRD